jgi:hypothetical protein
MSEMSENREAAEPVLPRADSQSAASPTVAAAPAGEQLDAIEDIEFLFEEIESKIAPLALA